MFLAYSLILLCVGVATLPSATMAAATGAAAPVTSELSASVNKFSNDLYKTVSLDTPGNVIMSPLSAQTVLALVHQGAGGETEQQLAKGLHLSLTKQSSADNFKTLMTSLNNQKGVTLNIANKVYTMEGYEMTETFKKVAVESFLAEAENLNFAKNDESAGVINKWVEDKTNQKIKNLISPDSLSSDTRMVLVNAIYFKGNWAKQFLPERTENKPFYTSETNSVEVPTMHMKNNFRYSDNKDLDAKIIELPYKDSDLSMLIILPNSRTGLPEVERKLQSVDLNEIVAGLWSVEVNVALPKFKIESTLKLNDILKKMGMTDMFDSKANFTGLLNTPERLYVSEVIQKAFIEVNEEGAEAAAATVVKAKLRTARVRPTVDIIVDHPFFYGINSGADHWLFTGRAVTI